MLCPEDDPVRRLDLESHELPEFTSILNNDQQIFSEFPLPDQNADFNATSSSNRAHISDTVKDVTTPRIEINNVGNYHQNNSSGSLNIDEDSLPQSIINSSFFDFGLHTNTNDNTSMFDNHNTNNNYNQRRKMNYGKTSSTRKESKHSRSSSSIIIPSPFSPNYSDYDADTDDGNKTYPLDGNNMMDSVVNN